METITISTFLLQGPSFQEHEALFVEICATLSCLPKLMGKKNLQLLFLINISNKIINHSIDSTDITVTTNQLNSSLFIWRLLQSALQHPQELYRNPEPDLQRATVARKNSL